MKRISILLIILALFSSCQDKKPSSSKTKENAVVNACNSVYYWKTTFRLQDEERKFLTDHKIQKLYLRFFDVSFDNDYYKPIPVPVATLQFIDSIPTYLKIIPTVFIVNELFNKCDMTGVDSLLVERIFKMSETNDVPNFNEIQIDCDWTKTTEIVYFDFLRRIRKRLDSTIKLSATIRLHQLNMLEPPVDKGVLMCYNTGGIRNPQTANSILSANDVALYSKKVKDYVLPLDVAYPTFSWAVWFQRGEFKALLRGLFSDNENLRQKKDNVYTVKEGFYQEGKYLASGDEIRFETSDFSEILKVKKLVENQLSDYSIILYHLDSKSLSKYSNDEIKQIYSH